MPIRETGVLNDTKGGINDYLDHPDDQKHPKINNQCMLRQNFEDTYHSVRLDSLVIA